MSSYFANGMNNLMMLFGNRTLRVLEVLGVLFIGEQVFFNLLRLHKSRQKEESNCGAVNDTVNKLKENSKTTSTDMDLLVESKSNREQVLIIGTGIHVTTTLLQKMINDHSTKIKEDVKVLCNSLADDFNTLRLVLLDLIEKTNEEFSHQEMKDALYYQVRDFKEFLRKEHASLQKLRDDHVESARVKFLAVQESFCNHVGGLVDMKIAKSDEVKALRMLESKLRSLIAALEICIVRESKEDQSIELMNQPEDLVENFHPTIFLWKISNFRQQWLELMDADKNEDIKSLVVFAVAPWLKIKAALTRGSEVDGINIQVEACDCELAGDPTVLAPFSYYRKYVLLDQSADSEKDDIEAFDRPGFRMNTVEDMLLPYFRQTQLCSTEDLAQEGKYVRNDTVLIKIVIEPIVLVITHIAFSKGFINWKIENYSMKKQDAIAGRKHWLISEPFRTSATGYYLQAEIALNGPKSGRLLYISTRLTFLLGEHDAELPPPLNGVCKFCLMDQSESPQEDIVVFRTFGSDVLNLNRPPVARTNVVRNWLCTKFLPTFQVEKEPYMVKDSILLKVIVDIES